MLQLSTTSGTQRRAIYLSFTLQRRLSHPVMSLVSVVGVAFLGLKHLPTPVWNAAHQPPQLVLVQVIPLFLDSNGELSHAHEQSSEEYPRHAVLRSDLENAPASLQ